jgi:hypothetical protein
LPAWLVIIKAYIDFTYVRRATVMTKWIGLRELVRDEIKQRGEEGCIVEGMSERLEAAGTDEAKLMEVYQALMALEPRADFKYIEPSDLETIRAERPDGPRILSGNGDELKMAG